jgi:hypothetical protein
MTLAVDNVDGGPFARHAAANANNPLFLGNDVPNNHNLPMLQPAGRVFHPHLPPLVGGDLPRVESVAPLPRTPSRSSNEERRLKRARSSPSLPTAPQQDSASGSMQRSRSLKQQGSGPLDNKKRRN